ncbi:hypothetical protein LOC67_00470 [Stieleria sp. JC731]|uniref:hypothetical protein n=1 Tax=Pirellulaceae TaxID=2691357 RepID=UPI001E4919A8|nr:hypothetical protein [Stieleria sp. JC731]MCC9599014.1 hypothetical protein [Stieleria sp. JC731]
MRGQPNPYELEFQNEPETPEPPKSLLKTKSIANTVMWAAIAITVVGPGLRIYMTFRMAMQQQSVEPAMIAHGISRGLLIGVVMIPVMIVAFFVRSWATIRLRREGFDV